MMNYIYIVKYVQIVQFIKYKGLHCFTPINRFDSVIIFFGYFYSS